MEYLEMIIAVKHGKAIMSMKLNINYSVVTVSYFNYLIGYVINHLNFHFISKCNAVISIELQIEDSNNCVCALHIVQGTMS